MEHVAIIGNHAFADSDLTGALATRPPHGLIVRRREPFDPLTVEMDRHRIVAFYREHGYFAATVSEVKTARVSHDRVSVAFHVVEGQPTRIADIEVQGAPPGFALEPELRLGEVFVHPRYRAAKDHLRMRLQDAGYAHVGVRGTVAVDRDRCMARVTLAVDPGPRVRFGQPHIHGLGKVPAAAIRSRLAWRPGTPFSREPLERTQERLYELGVFSAVRLELERVGRPEVADVHIHVREGARHEVRLGVGVAVDRAHWEVRGRAGYAVRGWLHPLLTLRGDARPAATIIRSDLGERGLAGQATIGLTREDFLAARLRLAAEAAYALEETETYAARGPRGRLTLSRPFVQDKLVIGAGWQVRWLTFERIPPELDVPYRLAFFEEHVAWDDRDSPLDARRGIYAELRFEQGTSFAGGSFRYVRVTPDVRGYLALDRLVLAGRARLGIAEDGTPITERYFGGGASGHRGFAYRRLSPWALAPDGERVPVGGGALLESSLEARIDLFRWGGRWVGAVLFLDGGDVTARPQDLSPTGLHWAAGAGLRYDTIVGPVRLDLGVRLNRTAPSDPEPGARMAVHFSLGEAF